LPVWKAPQVERLLDALKLFVVNGHLVQADDYERNNQIAENKGHHWRKSDPFSPACLFLDQLLILLFALLLRVGLLRLQIVERFSNRQALRRQFQLLDRTDERQKQRILFELRQRLVSAL